MDLGTVLSYYSVIATAFAIGAVVQLMKQGFKAFAPKVNSAQKGFIYKASAYLLGLITGIPPGWMPTQIEGNLLIERLVLGLLAAGLSDLAYKMVRKKFPQLSSKV